jgi:hypothetical protein
MIELVGRRTFRIANWLLASSPTLNTRALILVPICAAAFLLFHFLFSPHKLLFYNYFYVRMYDLNKYQTTYNTCETNERIKIK